MKKLVLGLIALGFSVGVNAACDKKSLKGGYEAMTQQENACSTFTGFIFNGAGTFTASFQQNCKGSLGEVTTISGTYTVAKSISCSVSAIGVGTNANQYAFNLYLEPTLKNGFVSVLNPQNYNAASFGQVLKTQ